MEQTLEISALNISQLSQLKQQLDQDIDLFSQSIQQLKMAQQKFQESLEACENITPATEGKEILVPLSSSMYVPGIVNECDKVIVDIGTGYYVEKSIKGGADYFHRKVKFVTEQMEKIQSLVGEKMRLRELLVEHMQMKIQHQLSAGKQAAS